MIRFKIIISENNRLFFVFITMALLVAVSTNCKNTSTSAVKQTNETNILHGKGIELSETFSAIDLEIADSMLIVLCYGDQYKFHVYNINTLKLIGKFGQEGRGPSEYVLPKMMSQRLIIRDSAYLIVYDDVLRRVNYINILKAINSKNYYPMSINSRDRMLSQISILKSAIIVDDSLIIGSSGDSHFIEGSFFCYDINNDKLNWEPFYPIPKIPLHETNKDEIYASYLALRPNGKDIAAASVYSERIDILDNKGKLKHSIIFENQDKQDLSDTFSSPPKGAHQYFTSISVSQDFIYSLNIDEVIGAPEIIDTVSLVKTTWEDNGLPTKIFKITPRILKMEVDEKGNRIFGLKYFSSTIYVYNIGQY